MHATDTVGVEFAIGGALKRIPVGGLVRRAKSFYELLGNRRKYARMPSSGTIYLTCKGHAIDTTHECSCVDVSPRGLGIRCPEQLSVGRVLHVHSEENGPRRLAQVRYCIADGELYRIGLEFTSGAKDGQSLM